MRSASISVGVVDYVHDHYRASEMRLRFADDDARAFSRYAALAEGSATPAERHRVLVDRNASLDRLTAEFGDIATLGALDVFFLYLSGHGEQGGLKTGGWFCLADAQPEKESLSGRRLSELLGLIRADHVCVVIDCCYAEAIGSGLTYFSALEGSKSRFLMASARSDQRSWEDEGLRRSLFSDVLLRALSSDSPIRSTTGYVDVEAGLFPYLRQQVPLLAASEKRGHVQEPVAGGLSSTGLQLPTVASQSLGRPLTTAQAIRAGVRRVVIGALVGSVVALLLLDLLIYHLAVNSGGQIVIRPGLRSTFSLQPFHPASTIDTGVKVSDLDIQNDDFIKRLAAGTQWGFRTHVGPDGLRSWLRILEEGVDQQTHSSLRVLARGERLEFPPDDAAPPIIETAFLSRLEGASAAALGPALYDNRRRVKIACGDEAGRNLDFTLIAAGSEVFKQDALWAAVTAPTAGRARAMHLFELVKLNAYRYFHRNEEQELLAEFLAFASAVEVITAPDREQEAFRAAAKDEWPKIEETWCELPATFARAMATDGATSHLAEAKLWEKFRTYRRDVQGDSPTIEQSIAMEALAMLARRRPLDATKMEALATEIKSDAIDIATNVPSHVLAWKLAMVQPLPETLTSYLMDKLGPATREYDFDPLVAVRILACNARFLDEVRKNVVKSWLVMHAVENRTMHDVHEALGCAGLLWSLSPEQLEILVTRLSPASRFPPRTVNYRGETVISSSGDEAAVALGMIAQKRKLEPQITNQLASIVAARSDLKQRGAILSGLAFQWYGGVEDAALIYARLFSAGADHIQRELEIDAAATMLRKASRDRSNAVAADLVRFWRSETEPELRIAIARILGDDAMRAASSSRQ